MQPVLLLLTPENNINGNYTTGSGFKSLHPYRSGYFGAAIKLQPGYTAGVITSFYVRTVK